LSEDVHSVLFLCLPGIGDSLFAVPAVRALKRERPGVHITAVTMFPGARDLLRLYSEIDEVINWDFMAAPWWRSLGFVFTLRRRRFDACIVTYPGNRLEYNVVAYLTGARKRFGHRYTHRDLRCANWLSTHSVRESEDRTNVEENLRLVELLLGKSLVAEKPDVPLSAESVSWAKAWFKERTLEGQTVVGFHAGGSTHKNHLHKRWPSAHFCALGRILTRKRGARILLFGCDDEAPLKTEIAEGIGNQAIIVTSPCLGHTCALVAQCDYFVANDNALLHLARALGVPATGIFGPTNPAWVRLPATPCHEVTLGMECQPCFYYSPRHLRCHSGGFECLTDLGPESVAKEILETRGSPRWGETTCP
jgi:heptosyltransferase-2